MTNPYSKKAKKEAIKQYHLLEKALNKDLAHYFLWEFTGFPICWSPLRIATEIKLFLSLPKKKRTEWWNEQIKMGYDGKSLTEGIAKYID